MSGIDVYAKLALRMKYPKSERMKLIFEKMVNMEEAEILLELPSPSDEIAEKLNLDKETVDAMIRILYQKGLAIPTSKGYFLPRAIGQLHDTALTDPNLTTELADLWQEFSEEEWFPDHAEELAGAEEKFMRILPAWKAIQTSSTIVPGEDVRQIIQESERVAVAPCPCRIRARLCDGPIDTCLQLNKAADYVSQRGTGRLVSKEEAIEILGRSEEAGLIHTAPPFSVVCSCCTCCCNMLRPLDKAGKVSEGMIKSSYRSIINEELCTECGLCVERCRFGAIETKNGKIIIDTEKCFGCGSCVVICPVEGALKLELAEGIAAP